MRLESELALQIFEVLQLVGLVLLLVALGYVIASMHVLLGDIRKRVDRGDAALAQLFPVGSTGQTLMAVFASKFKALGDNPDDAMILKLVELARGKITAEQFSDWWSSVSKELDKLTDGLPPVA